MKKQAQREKNPDEIDLRVMDSTWSPWETSAGTFPDWWDSHFEYPNSLLIPFFFHIKDDMSAFQSPPRIQARKTEGTSKDFLKQYEIYMHTILPKATSSKKKSKAVNGR